MKFTYPSPTAVITPVVEFTVALELLVVRYVIDPSLFNEDGAAIILTGTSP